MQFSKRITDALQESNYTQKQIAKELNISAGNITNWKKGENLPSVDILYKLCILLNESADYLLGLEDETGAKTYPKYNIGSINQNGNGSINFK